MRRFSVSQNWKRTDTCQPENWPALIRNHISRGSSEEALSLYAQIRRNGFQDSPLLLVPLVLKACVSIRTRVAGKAIHAESLKLGTISDVLVGTSLVSAYAKSGEVRDARKVFDEIPLRNVVTWNAMIGGYFKNGDSEAALEMFEAMPERTPVTWIEMISGLSRIAETERARKIFDIVPPEQKNVVTWTVMVDGYCVNGEMGFAREIFDQMPERNPFAWSSMISGYSKTGDLKRARVVFDQIPGFRNLVNWNSMISGYVQNGFARKALEVYREMRSEGFEPDEVTFASVLSACAHSGSMKLGKEIHRLMIVEKRVRPNRIVLNALIDMYAKCGDLRNARLVFEGSFYGVGERNTACWNAMISGLAVHGRSEEALELFRRMLGFSDERPDDVTFLGVLSACAHGGLVDEGVEIFSKTMVKHGVEANVKHYGCLVDLLGRAGRLKEAHDLIKRMPMGPNDAVWGALLGACRLHSNVEMTESVVGEIEILDTKSGLDVRKNSHYAILSNIYADSDKWEKAERMRLDMANKGLEKTAGFSSVF